jgi:hypothetical protein
MPRPDLLALSADDLAALTNRGTVKRAQREVEAGECTTELTETPEGDVTAKWCDGVECHLPAGVVVREGRCSCAAVTLCRHLVRTVLAYQRQAQQQSDQPAAATGPWDPGAITEEEIARHYRPAVLARLRAQFQQGVLVELVRSSKPNARFHLQACLLRFLVPGDLRYTHCDCAEVAPCSHVPLAVWSFRLLDAAQPSGIVATGEKAPAAPVDLLNDLEAALLEFTEHGVSAAAAAWKDRLTRLEDTCRQADLVWPAEILAELIQQQERYAGHDARFEPERVAELIGELLIRSDAIRRDTGALPQLLIRGASADRPAALGAARFVGLGCGVRTSRRSVELSAYLQDSDSGGVVAFRREIEEAEPDPVQPPRPFSVLALASAIKGSSFAALGVGQLLIRGGKRTASFHLLPGRADASVQPQAFTWESLRPPVLVEEFAELDARLAALPPSALRPRRVAEDFHVCTVAGTESVHFAGATHTVQAVLRDSRGQQALLVHPFTSRGQGGAEALLARLSAEPQKLRFVSGPVRRGASGLVLHPVCLVWQEDWKRTALQPWVEERPGALHETLPSLATAIAIDPLGDYWRQVQAGLGDLFLLGLQRADDHLVRRWRDLQRQGEAVGFARLAGRAALLADALEQKRHTLTWDWQRAGRVVLELAVLARMAQDLASS